MSKDLKVPKRVAGVKIPKSLRKGPLRDFVSSTHGRALLAEAVEALVSAFPAVIDDESPTAGEVDPGPVDHGLHEAEARIAAACEAAVRAFRDALQRDVTASPISDPGARATEAPRH